MTTSHTQRNKEETQGRKEKKGVNWNNPEEVKEYVREYQREYYQRPEVKEHVREYMRERWDRLRKGDFFSWDDMAEMIREKGTVNITKLPNNQQKVFLKAAKIGIIRIENNLASKTALTHALDGFVMEAI
jgi:hypothetical protein